MSSEDTGYKKSPGTIPFLLTDDWKKETNTRTQNTQQELEGRASEILLLSNKINKLRPVHDIQLRFIF